VIDQARRTLEMGFLRQIEVSALGYGIGIMKHRGTSRMQSLEFQEFVFLL
jgi:hypothetical protein